MNNLIDIKGYRVVYDWVEYSGLAVQDMIIDKINRNGLTFHDAHFLTVYVIDRNGQLKNIDDFADMFTFVKE